MPIPLLLPNSKLLSFLVLILLVLSFSGAVLAKETKQIRMGIISLASPAKIHEQWQPFAKYLSDHTGWDVKIVIPRGFKKIKEAVSNKSVDIFYVNSLIFYRLKKEGKAQALAQMMNLNGTIVSKSVMFVRNDSGIDNLEQLKGEKVAFVAPMGAGGYLAPRAAFYKAGIKTQIDTKEEFTKNLSSSIHKVLLGDVKAATMCGLNFKLMSKRMETGDLKIIASSGDYPENTFGIRADLPQALREKLTSVIIGMDSDSQGRAVLDQMAGMKILKFVPYDDNTEKITEGLLREGEF
jgi:phosphonate transport system substrate-binding protein